MDPIGTAETIFAVAQQIYSIYQTCKENQALCLKLIERLRSILQILESNDYKKRLVGAPMPLCIKGLLEICFDCQDFIQYFGQKGPIATLRIIAFSSGVNASFQDLNTKLSQNVNDCTFYFAKSTDQKMESLLQKFDELSASSHNTQALTSSQNHYSQESASVVVWVDPIEVVQTKNELVKENPKLVIKQCFSTKELKDFFFSSRSIKTDQCKPFRIITNRRRLFQGSTTEYNEKAYMEVIDFVRKDNNGQTPILVFMGNNDLAKSLNSEISSSIDFKNKRSPYVHVTTSTITVKNFALMNTILFVWPQAYIQTYEEALLNYYHENGIVVELRYTFDDAMKFLLTNPDLRTNPRFKMVIPRVFYIDGVQKSMTEFVSEARFRGFHNHILVFTSLANYDTAKTAYKEYRGVVVATDQTAAEAFALERYDQPHLEEEKVEVKEEPKVELPMSPHLERKEKRGMFVVYAVSCKDLAPKDANGKSDPYVVFECGNEVTQTYVIYKTLNPVFERGCYRLSNLNTKDKIKITVWDKDKFGSDFEGKTEIHLEELCATVSSKTPTRIITKKLEQREGKKYAKEIVTGTITLEVTFFVTDVY